MPVIGINSVVAVAATLAQVVVCLLIVWVGFKVLKRRAARNSA